ncbi:early transcribed membrane protein [Plasmodium relictum]|uniref:Early transcribed membrane protein n=1 Tax=Plasmodium relictum TaxID=85471 RepID=A0A1J1GKD6_PLARL|nr:early transcribed membrane protein [Plasmodium relictum]CRG85086.1 early transcribed membrane protein [Plasmodium relictum]
MKISKIFYLFNILFSINLLVPCFCLDKNEFLKNKSEIYNINKSIEKKDKKKKIIIYSISALAAVLLAAGLLGGGLYLTRDRRKSIWKNPVFGKEFEDIFFSTIDQVDEDVKKIIEKGEKQNYDKIFTKKYVKSVMDKKINESEIKFSGTQKREFYTFVPYIHFKLNEFIEENLDKPC